MTIARSAAKSTAPSALDARNGKLATSQRQTRAACQERERARQREAEIGAAVQQQLLFGAPPTTLAGYDIACYSEPSQDVDGDFYTFTQLGPSTFEVLAGDVMGKGIAAALIAAGINDAYRKVFAELLAAQPANVPTPAALVNAIHTAVTAQLIAVDSFVTLVLLRFDGQAQTLTWVNAGHTPSLLHPAGQPQVHELLGTNLPLGVIADESYAQHVAPFASGDTLLIYSDGLSESLGAGQVDYGAERIKALLAGSRPAGPAQILDRLRADLHRHTDGAKAADDRSAIVITAPPVTL